jgi:hypothetical protein
MSRALRIGIAAVALALCACAPVTVARIGPLLAPRTGDCAVEVLDRGEVPKRPYRDVGLVTVESCQDYRTPPCRGWIEEAVCGLGGQVAYVSEDRRPDPGLAPMRAQVLAAVYISDLRPAPDDPVLASRRCDPPCGAGAACVDGECRPAGDAGCPVEGAKPAAPAATTAEGPEKCLE